MQALTLLVVLGGVGLFWKWSVKWDRDAGPTRDGICVKEWQRMAEKVGPLGKWQNTKVAALQRELAALEKQFNKRSET